MKNILIINFFFFFSWRRKKNIKMLKMYKKNRFKNYYPKFNDDYIDFNDKFKNYEEAKEYFEKMSEEENIKNKKKLKNFINEKLFSNNKIKYILYGDIIEYLYDENKRYIYKIKIIISTFINLEHDLIDMNYYKHIFYLFNDSIYLEKRIYDQYKFCLIFLNKNLLSFPIYIKVIFYDFDKNYFLNKSFYKNYIIIDNRNKLIKIFEIENNEKFFFHISTKKKCKRILSTSHYLKYKNIKRRCFIERCYCSDYINSRCKYLSDNIINCKIFLNNNTKKNDDFNRIISSIVDYDKLDYKIESIPI